MLLTLERSIIPYKNATLGSLFNDEGTFHSFALERAWENNRPSKSCVPAGEYELVPHKSPRHGQTWALAGRTVSHLPSPLHERNLILFHAANWASQLAGCIAPGYTATVTEAGPRPVVGVFKSAAAVNQLLKLLHESTARNGHWLHIIDP